MIVCVLENYEDDQPLMAFFDTDKLRATNDAASIEFADLLEIGDDIEAEYGKYGLQARMISVDPPCFVEKAITLMGGK